MFRSLDWKDRGIGENLQNPDPTMKFILDTDCSNRSMGAVMLQEQQSGERVVAYFSKTLNKAEQNYTQPGKSCWR